jgi:restriction endonuclease S subunit
VLLKGLEVSEVMLSELKITNYELRLDAEFYKKEYLLNDKITEKYRIEKLKDITSKIDVGFVGTMVKYYTDDGIPLLQTKNINDFFVNDIETTQITNDFHTQLKKSQINYEDILIARSGSFGKASIYLKKETINSSDIIIIRAKELKINPYYLVAYLNSKSGVGQMLRFASGGLQGHVNLTILEELKVPILSLSFQQQIEDKVKDAHAKREQSQTLYHRAEDILLETLGLKDFQPSQENIKINSFKNSFLATGRLDAEYYQPKYEEIENLIRNFAGGYSFVNKEFEHNKTTIDYSAKQYHYIEIGDVNVGNGAYSYNLINTEELPANAKIKAQKNNILVSKVRPNRGAISIMQEEIPDLVVSGAFTVLQEKTDYKKETLFIFLRLEMVRDLLLKYNVGTSYPVVKDEDVLNLPIPLINNEIQQQIAALIEKSFYLRTESERLLQEAKEMVEREIEKN